MADGHQTKREPDRNMKTIKTLSLLPNDPAAPGSLSSAAATGAPRPVRIERAAPSHVEIESRAYEIWLAQGQPHGQDQRHWFEAERQLHHR